MEQKFIKAKERADRMKITSPINGVVMGISVTTKNQVVTTGEELMRIVPEDKGIEIEAYAQNKDIGFINIGQRAVVKIDAFPFTRFGSLDAKVTTVAHDAIPEPDAQLIESNPSKSNKSKYFGGMQRTQNLVFPVTLMLDKNSLIVDGKDIPLSSGMTVTVEILTGKRRIIDYILSPLVETTSQAMREK